MYKCLNCGNTDKFVGTAQEKGAAEFSRSGNDYQWSYRVSDSTWESDIKIKYCYYCHSTKIVKI